MITTCIKTISQNQFFYPGSFVGRVLSITFLAMLIFFSFACKSSEEKEMLSDLEKAETTFEELLQDPNNTVVGFPEENPGIPIYARVGPILNQFFVAENRLVIPFYRNPECVPDSFNLLNYYDPPVAFSCELTVAGRFVTEKDVDEDTFPIMAHTEGVQVPIWIVDWPVFENKLESGSVTMTNLRAMNPTMGIANRFEEYLSPRMNEHQVILEAVGTIFDTGEEFTFRLTHRADLIEEIFLEIK